jgi:hypothetical protein
MDYLNGGRWTLIGEFTEVESGKRSDKPELEKALAACKRQKVKLVISKLDRLSRNLAFIAIPIPPRRAWRQSPVHPATAVRHCRRPAKPSSPCPRSTSSAEVHGQLALHGVDPLSLRFAPCRRVSDSLSVLW